ncbi:MAG: hypothetical protein AAGL08_13905 [Cyanobacteria bacterium J06573_11]
MPATPPPSPSEHLQSTLRRFYNREVKDWFDDVDIDDLDINIPRQSLALACRHLDDDSGIMTLQRQLLFNDIKSRFARAIESTGETRYRTNVRRRHRPQITLFFLEDLADVEPGFTPVTGRISFRLMNYDSSTITPLIATPYAQRIKSTFALGSGFVWRKGREMFSYSDWNRGYQLQLLCRSKTEARRVVDAVLDIQNDTPDWSNFNTGSNEEPAEAYPTLPANERIFGETRRAPRTRPVADVRFQYADLSVSGLSNPITLVDRSGVYPNPLVS